MKRFLQIGLGLVLAFALPAQLQAQDGASEVAALDAGTASAAQQCLACLNCRVNGQPGHRLLNRAPRGSEFGLDGDSPHGCEPEGFCCNTEHGTPCGAPCGLAALPIVQPLAEAAEQKASDIQLVALAQAAQDAGYTVELNHARSAIQLLGCTENVVAHITLAPAQLAALDVSEQFASRHAAVANQ